MTGILITFEGIDYSGKSLQAGRLISRLQAMAVPVLSLRDPGATAISEKIRAILLDNRNREMSPWAELLLYEAARAQMIEQLIKPALAQGQVVVCDRLYDSTTAYQGHGRQLDLELVGMANRLGACGLVPHLTFLLDVPAEEAALRRQKMSRAADRMEKEGVLFQERVRQGYLQIAGREPDRFRVIDGGQDIESVQEMVWTSFTNKWPSFSNGRS